MRIDKVRLFFFLALFSFMFGMCARVAVDRANAQTLEQQDRIIFQRFYKEVEYGFTMVLFYKKSDKDSHTSRLIVRKLKKKYYGLINFVEKDIDSNRILLSILQVNPNIYPFAVFFKDGMPIGIGAGKLKYKQIDEVMKRMIRLKLAN